MPREPGDPRGGDAAGLGAGSDAELMKAGQSFMEQVRASGQDVDILELVARAVSPLTQLSNPSRFLQAVYATVTLEEFLTLKMRCGDGLSIEEIAQRQGRPIETVQREIARSCARIRMHQFNDQKGE